MPAIRRNIGANVPALTAGNGKPCYRGNAPSCQRLMKFSYTLSGTIDFTPLYQYWQDEYQFDPADAVASSIDAALISDRLRTGLARDYTAFNDYYENAAYPDMVFGSVQTRVPNAQGVDVAYIRRWLISAGLVWDAAAWHWAAKVGVWLDVALLSGGFNLTEAWTTYSSSNSGGSYALFVSAQSAQNIRLGAQGWNLYFDSIVGNDALSGAAAALQNVVINLKAAWA